MADPAALSSVLAPPSLDAQITRLYGQQQDAYKQEGALFDQSKGIAEKEKTALAEKEAAVAPIRDKQVAEAKNTPEAPKEEKAPNYQRPTMDPEDLKKTFGVLMAVSMLVGLSSRDPYNNVANAMTGALNGFMKKDEELVKDSMVAFDKNLAAIKERNDGLRKDYEAAWKKHGNDMAALKLELEAVAAKWDMPMAQYALEKQSVSESIKAIEAHIKSNETALERLDKTAQQAKDAQARLDEAKLRREEMAAFHAEMSGQSNSMLTPDGQKAYLELLRAGKPIPKTRRGQRDDEALNMLGATELGGAGSGDIVNAEMQYKNRQAVLKDFTSGQTKKNIVAINQAIAHMGTLDELGKALKNKDTQLYNQAMNAVASQFGDPRINNFELATQAVGDELMRTFRQVGASETEAQAFQKRFQAAGSPEKQREALQTGAHLLAGRIMATNNDWKRSYGTDEDYKNMLDPVPRKVLEGFGITDPFGPKPSAGGAVGGVQDGATATNHETGEKLIRKGGKWVPADG